MANLGKVLCLGACATAVAEKVVVVIHFVKAVPQNATVALFECACLLVEVKACHARLFVPGNGALYGVLDRFGLFRPVHQEPYDSGRFAARLARKFVGACADRGVRAGVVLGAPNGRGAVVDDLGLEQVIDGLFEGVFHFAAGSIVNDVAVERRRRIGDVHHGYHRADHGVVVERNLVAVFVALGPNLREPAFGTLHCQQKVDGLVETRLEGGFVVGVGRCLVTLGEESHFLDRRVVIDGADVAATCRTPSGLLPT